MVVVLVQKELVRQERLEVTVVLVVEVLAPQAAERGTPQTHPHLKEIMVAGQVILLLRMDQVAVVERQPLGVLELLQQQEMGAMELHHLSLVQVLLMLAVVVEALSVMRQMVVQVAVVALQQAHHILLRLEPQIQAVGEVEQLIITFPHL
jgi:hypothetical protein